MAERVFSKRGTGFPGLHVKSKNKERDAVVLFDKVNTAPTSSGTTYAALYVNSSGNLVFTYNGSDTTLGAPGAGVALNDIGDPSANNTIALAGYTDTRTSTLDGGSVMTLSNTVADLTTDTRLLELKFTDDGDANGIFLRCLDNSGADAKFTVGADGATTIAGVASGTAALTLTAGDLVVTSGDITVSAGDIDIAADNRKVSFGASGDSDSYIHFDGSNLVFYDSTVAAEKTLSQLLSIDSSPTITGDVTISDGKLDWTDTADEVAGTWTFSATTNNCINVVANSLTTGTLMNMTANGLTSGSMVYLESSAAGMAGEYIRCNDGAADDFTVGANGAVIIAGSAAGTDALTLTAGDATLSSGDLSISIGTITVADTADSTNKISRNNATGTNPVVEVEQSHTTGGVALLVDQDATGDVNALEIENAGTGFAVTTTGGVAGSGGYEYIAAASATGIGLLLDGATNTWIGAASTGLLQATSDGTLADTSATLARLAFSGTSASGGAGTCLRVEDTSTSGGGTEYAVYISSTNSEALHIDAGVVQMDEALTLGVDDTGADLKAFGATSGKYMIWDESADQLQLTNSTEIVLGGTPGAEDGLSMQFNGTADVLFDAITADDAITIGSATNTDLKWHGAGGVALTCDASGNSLTVSSTAVLSATGTGTGDGLAIPTHATNSPSDTPAGAAIFFEQDAKKLWVYDLTTAGWVGVTLA